MCSDIARESMISNYLKDGIDSKDGLKVSSKLFSIFRNELRQATAMTTSNILKTAQKIVKSVRTEEGNAEMDDKIANTDSEIGKEFDVAWTEHHRDQCKALIPPSRIDQLRNIVQMAAKRHKIFSMHGNYITIRKSLFNRGWLEKFDDNAIPSLHDPFDDEEVYSNLPIRTGTETKVCYIKRCERHILSLFLKDCGPDLYWNYRLYPKELILLPRAALINRFLYTRFSTKAGLCGSLQNMKWFTDPDVSMVNFPRCYNISEGDDFKDFTDDFRISASLSLLKTFLFLYKSQGAEGVMDPAGSLRLYLIIQAVKLCHKYMAEKKNEDIDYPDFTQDENETKEFIQNCYLFVHKGKKFLTKSEPSLPFLEKTAACLLIEMLKYWPQFDIDGRLNIWIIKPAARCRGIGITLKSNYNEIQTLLIDNAKKCRYVAQKYIETPLLIYGHKFDIRQWFLITSIQPLTIWMYSTCYFRFSSKKFDLEDYHEVVHLTNNAVQYKYQNLEKEPELPAENMWQLHEFKNYLEYIGKAGYWESSIYPQIKKIIVGSILASYDFIDARPNCFQMFGADLMIDSNFIAWLLEINSCPQMGPTCAVTKKLCPECLEDIIKVVVDCRSSPASNTGRFELIYKNQLEHNTSQVTPSFEIVGKKLTLAADKNIPRFNCYRPPHITSVSDLLRETISYNDLNKKQREFVDKMETAAYEFKKSLENELKSEKTIVQKDVKIPKEPKESSGKVAEVAVVKTPSVGKIVREAAVNTIENEKRMLKITELYERNEKKNYKRIFPLHGGRAMLEVAARPRLPTAKSARIESTPILMLTKRKVGSVQNLISNSKGSSQAWNHEADVKIKARSAVTMPKIPEAAKPEVNARKLPDSIKTSTIQKANPKAVKLLHKANAKPSTEPKQREEKRKVSVATINIKHNEKNKLKKSDAPTGTTHNSNFKMLHDAIASNTAARKSQELQPVGTDKIDVEALAFVERFNSRKHVHNMKSSCHKFRS